MSFEEFKEFYVCISVAEYKDDYVFSNIQEGLLFSTDSKYKVVRMDI